jgi:hypothetical protein
MKVITNDISYNAKKEISSISQYKACIEKYSKNFESESLLKTQTPIFLDTNVLLRYYSISFTAREKLYTFIKKNAKRMILTKQVQYEFLKNREDVIQRFFEDVTNKIPKDFGSEVVNKMQSFLDTHKVVLKDYLEIEKDIKAHQVELEELLKKLNSKIDDKRKEHVNLITKDKFLELLATCTLYDGLIKEETDLVKTDFNSNAKSIAVDKLDSFLKKPNAPFPGAGDIKEKPDDPYGDFIIYHEMMKYMVSNNIDAIFLTFDTTKGDWMSKSKSPHLHYVLNMYSNSNQLLYIFDADRTLGELLNVNIESLVEIEKEIGTEITVESIENLFSRHNSFLKAPNSKLEEWVVIELQFNGYRTIEELTNHLNKARRAVRIYMEMGNLMLTKIGVLRASLRIVNPLYIYQANPSGDISKIDEERLEKYTLCRKYITK